MLFINIAYLFQKNLINNNNLFYITGSYILNIALIIFLVHFKKYILSLIISIILLAFSFSLCLSLKEKTGNHFFLSIPYFIYIIYIFASLINYFTNLNF